jgi:hypothetical protein
MDMDRDRDWDREMDRDMDLNLENLKKQMLISDIHCSDNGFIQYLDIDFVIAPISE